MTSAVWVLNALKRTSAGSPTKTLSICMVGSCASTIYSAFEGTMLIIVSPGFTTPPMVWVISSTTVPSTGDLIAARFC